MTKRSVCPFKSCGCSRSGRDQVSESDHLQFQSAGIRPDRSHNGRVIVAAEGPSAAGKTVWCRAHASDFVAEYVAVDAEPDGTDLDVHAHYWVSVNSARWCRAIALEQQTGLAICDSDPLKLHYSWCQAMAGAGPVDRFTHELDHSRAAFRNGELGFADLVFVSIPAVATLRFRRDADPSRRRRAFELHAGLAEHLRCWYEAVDALEPGRVIWNLPADVSPFLIAGPRTRRSDVALLDELVAQLPSPTSS